MRRSQAIRFAIFAAAVVALAGALPLAAVEPIQADVQSLDEGYRTPPDITLPVVKYDGVPPSAATVFTVTNTGDSGAGSLRQAITDANASVGPHTIEFAIPMDTDPNCDAVNEYCTIGIPGYTNELPVIESQTVLDGSTQTLSGTNAAGGPPIVLTNSSGLSAPRWGLAFANLDGEGDPDGSVLRGVAVGGITNASFGVGIYISATDSVTVEDCYLGTDWDGTTMNLNIFNIYVRASHNCTIQDSIVSYADASGILVFEESTGNKILGNHLGSGPLGTENQGNGEGAVYIKNSSSNEIGGPNSGDGNIIVYNGFNTTYYPQGTDGVYVWEALSADNLILGNRIGVDAANSAAGNARFGVLIQDASTGNRVGGPTTAERNVISGNGVLEVSSQRGGVAVDNTAYATVENNYIGVDATGGTAIPQLIGVLAVGGSTDVVIGTGNVISGHTGPGVWLDSTGESEDAIYVAGNRIGSNATGLNGIGNYRGVLVTSAAEEIYIGYPGVAYRNYIVASSQEGIAVDATEGVVIQNNSIGIGATPETILPNLYGVGFSTGSVGFVVGTPTDGNVIQYNTYEGVYTDDTSYGLISGNSMRNNGALGIDHLYDGVTEGTCAAHPYRIPVITNVTDNGATITVDGTSCFGSYIELFASGEPDPSGYGEGRTLIGSTTSNIITGIWTMTIDDPGDTWLTATAYSYIYGTSEFSGQYIFGEPTGIELLSFEATGEAGQAIIDWETATEADNAGFHVLRSESATGDRVRITGALIPAEGDAFTGARYEWIDEDVEEGATYYYWLEDIDVHGVSTLHGPAVAEIQSEPEPGFCGVAGGGAPLLAVLIVVAGIAVAARRRTAR